MVPVNEFDDPYRKEAIMRSVAVMRKVGNGEMTSASDERKFFVGVDVHKASFSVTVVDEECRIVKRAKMPSSSEALVKFLKRFLPARMRVCYEAGGFGYWLYDALLAAGYEACVVAPSMMYRKPGERVKTDKRDSRELASQLCRGMLTMVNVPEVPRRAHRQILRLYDQVKKERQRVMVRIKAFLRLHGVGTPVGLAETWSRRYMSWLRSVEFGNDAEGCLAFARDEHVSQYEFLCARERSVRSKLLGLAKLAAYEGRMEVLCSAKGMGKLTGLRLLLEIGSFSRFQNSRKFTSYLGLTPSENSSGDKQRRGSITGYGNFALRSSLVEVAWIVIRHDSSLRHTFAMLSRRRGAMRSIVAVARKFAIRLYWMVREEELLEEAA
jgi:transposase